MLLRVGLTGGIATGKSTVLSALLELGCLGLDADVLVHELLSEDSPMTRSIAECFGPDVILDGGGVDRERLSSIVFDDPERLGDLEALVHPAVERAIGERAREESLRLDERGDHGIFVVDAALLIEKRPRLGLHRIVVTACDREAQLSRLEERDGLSREDGAKRLKVQMPSDEKVLFADYLIDTTQDKEDTLHQCRQLYEALREDLELLKQGHELWPQAFGMAKNADTGPGKP
jgi:dephospho-CoA kinase